MKTVDELFTPEELDFIKTKRPDIVPMDVPSNIEGRLNEPSLDQLIVQFLDEKYNICVEPRRVGSWNGWDTLATLNSFAPSRDRYADNIASTMFYVHRSNQINNEAQEWQRYKFWVLDTKKNEFESYKNQILQSIIRHNQDLNNQLEVQIQRAEINNRKARLALRGLDARIYTQKLKERKDKQEQQMFYFALVLLFGIFVSNVAGTAMYKFQNQFSSEEKINFAK